MGPSPTSEARQERAPSSSSVGEGNALIIRGNKRIRQTYFDNVFSEFRGLPAGARGDEVSRVLGRAQEELRASGLFDEGVGLEAEAEGQRYRATLDVTGKEKQVLMAKVEGNVRGVRGENELRGAIEVGFRSPLGFGERMTFEEGFNYLGAPTRSFSLLYPHLVPPNAWTAQRSLRMSGSVSVENRTRLQSVHMVQHAWTVDFPSKNKFDATLRCGGVIMDECPATFQDVGKHFGLLQKSLDSLTREQAPPHAVENSSSSSSSSVMRFASPAILSQASSSFKYFVQASKSWAVRDGEVTGSVELALPPSNCAFFKSEIKGTFSWSVAQITGWFRNPYWHDVSVGLTCVAGTIRPLSLSSSSSRLLTRAPALVDRFYLGGPNSIRGFDALGMGPRSSYSYSSSGGDKAFDAAQGSAALRSAFLRGDSLGGLSKLAGVLSVHFPFPLLPPLPPSVAFLQDAQHARLFFALSGGWLESPFRWQASRGHSWGAFAQTVGRESRATVSCGVSFPLTQFGGDISLSLSAPVRAAPGDVAKGWQLSFGLGLGGDL